MPRKGTRSRSAPPRPTPPEAVEGESEHENENGSDTEAFPAVSTDQEYGVDTPAWLRDVTISRVGRQSRASSIVSTRTRFSTTTFDEARSVRSIEINAGGHSFRISRGGSKITETTAPPPYSGPVWQEDVEVDHDDPAPLHETELPPHDGTPDEQRDAQETRGRGHGKRVRIVMPDEDDTEVQADGDARDAPESSNRALTKADLYHLMLELPFQLKKVLGLRPFGQVQQSILRRSNSGEASGLSKTRPSSTQSLPDSFMLRDQPSATKHGKEMGARIEDRVEAGMLNQYELSDIDTSAEIIKPLPIGTDLSVPLTVMDLNELSLLYNRVIKDLDKEHRKKLHERDKELAQLRQLLNEKDIIYRQQLKGKDFVIEDLKKRLEHNEETMEGKLEKARNEVEDLWEMRWKDRDRHLMDRMRRIEEAINAQSSESIAEEEDE